MDLSELIKESGRVVVLTGAGMSTESGLKDFRSANGRWRDKDPRDIATVDALDNNYAEFLAFYNDRTTELMKHKPNIGHEILAKWEKQGLIECIITQNVDTYHEQAGSKNVIHLHGDLSWGKDYKGRKRPNVVLFGEPLPEEKLDRAAYLATVCDVMIVMGSSLQVAPANLLPRIAKKHGAKVVIINRETTSMDHITDLIYYCTISDVLKTADRKLAKSTH